MWYMSNILPQQAGLQVNSVFYRYTTVKNAEDPLLVHVQNKNALGEGYIFRSTDDWSGLPSNRINKNVPTGGIDIEYWGDGSIETEGFGTVEDVSVVYTYKYDPCFDPQSRPDCPGYKDPFDLGYYNVEVVDPLDDDYIQDEINRKAVLNDDDQKDRDRKRVESKKKIDKRLENIMSIVEQALVTAEAQVQAAEFFAMKTIPVSYSINISGGVYEESTRLIDSKLPENRNGLRNNLAQQLMHQEMVDSQYNKNKGE
jgi:hypothetical protein